MADDYFDNKDNPYGKFVLHQYTNMDDMYDTTGSRQGFVDVEIPLKTCNDDVPGWSNSTVKLYCADYNETHFIHGHFSSDKFSWLRLAYHECDYYRDRDTLQYRDCAPRD